MIQRRTILAQWPTLALCLLGMGILSVALIWPASEYSGGRRAFAGVYAIQFLLYGLACWLVWPGAAPTGRTPTLIITFALAFRIALLVTDPYLSDDAYRYVWDGRVQAAGINPYRYIPTDGELVHLRDEAIFPHINRRDYAPTIYPPGAQMMFLGAQAVFGSHIWAIKLTLIGLDLLTMVTLGLLLQQLAIHPGRLILYAWHPLVLWEVAHSGHIDAAALAFMVAALLVRVRGRLALTGVLLGLATLVKLYPVMLLPAVYKKWDWKLPAALLATVALGYLPYLGVGWGVIGFLPGYLKEERFSTGQRFFPLEILRLVTDVPTWVYVAVAAVILGLVAWKVLDRAPDQRQYAAGGVLLAGTALLLGTPHYAWYFLWLLPFLCLRFSAAWFYLASTAVLLYFISDRSVSKLVFGCIQYIPVYGLLIWKQLTRRQPG